MAWKRGVGAIRETGQNVLRATAEELLTTHDLDKHSGTLLRLARPCVRGNSTARTSPSFAGGLPWIDEGFEWPSKDQRPLQFVCQVETRHLPEWKNEPGFLLFFYSNRHWGGSRKDSGHTRVIWQRGSRPLSPEELPTLTSRKSLLFWNRSRTYTARITRQIFLDFYPCRSFPSLGRGVVPFPADDDREAYSDFLTALDSPLQLGGYPSPVQNDDMERTCQRLFQARDDDWTLLLQSHEIGDQRWGDAGRLYWFLPRPDLASGRLDRAWVISQSY